MFRRGVVLNLTNPKAVLAWTAVLALGLEPAAGASALTVTTLACSLLGMAIYVTYALAFSQAPVRAAYRAGRRAIDAVAGVLFGYAGLRLLAMR
jgi:threonine/homoserine/homoserine lactone efflux protein